MRRISFLWTLAAVALLVALLAFGASAPASISISGTLLMIGRLPV